MTAVRSNEGQTTSILQRLIELQAIAQMQIAKADERQAQADERQARADERMALAEESFVAWEQRLAVLQPESNERFQTCGARH